MNALLGYPPGMAGALDQMQPGGFGPPRPDPRALMGVELGAGGGAPQGPPGVPGMGSGMPGPGGSPQMPPEMLAALSALRQQAQQMQFAPPGSRVGQQIVPAQSLAALSSGGRRGQGRRMTGDEYLYQIQRERMLRPLPAPNETPAVPYRLPSGNLGYET